MLSMNKQRASTLVEVLIAVSIIALVLTSVSAMITMSIKLANSNEQKQLALQKTQEALEFFRKERAVNSWHSFSGALANDGIYCLSSLPESIASMSAKLGACTDQEILEAAKYQFQREANISFNDANSLKVIVEVFWQDNTRNKNLVIEQNFDNY